MQYLKLAIIYHLIKWRLPGPAPVIAAGNSDDDQDRDWKSDDQRDFEDQQPALQSPMAQYPGSRNPLARFLPNVVLDKAALDKALQGLLVPMAGPAPPGISVQEAIKVRIPSPPVIHPMSYALLYTILHDVNRIRHRMRCRVQCLTRCAGVG